jgi:hypothetical protein
VSLIGSHGIPIHNGGDWQIAIRHIVEPGYRINWTLIDSNGNEASQGDKSSGDNHSRKYIINCKNRPLQDRLPFDVVMDVTNPESKEESKFSFYTDWSMPNACKPGWWTGTTDGKNSAGANECAGYSSYKMHCDGWEKWGANTIMGERQNPNVIDPNGGQVREFRCWFPYLGTGGDKAPPGSRRGIETELEEENDTALWAAAVEFVEEEGAESPRLPVREISSLRRGWRALFGR